MARQSYRLRNIGSGTYVAKYTGTRDDPHWGCATCYREGTISVLQFFGTEDAVDHWQCWVCAGKGRPNLIDVPRGTKPELFKRPD